MHVLVWPGWLCLFSDRRPQSYLHRCAAALHTRFRRTRRFSGCLWPRRSTRGTLTRGACATCTTASSCCRSWKEAGRKLDRLEGRCQARPHAGCGHGCRLPLNRNNWKCMWDERWGLFAVGSCPGPWLPDRHASSPSTARTSRMATLSALAQKAMTVLSSAVGAFSSAASFRSPNCAAQSSSVKAGSSSPAAQGQRETCKAVAIMCMLPTVWFCVETKHHCERVACVQAKRAHPHHLLAGGLAQFRTNP